MQDPTRSGVGSAAFPHSFDKIVTGDSRKSSISDA
jgi:hypothetical protein